MEIPRIVIAQTPQEAHEAFSSQPFNTRIYWKTQYIGMRLASDAALNLKMQKLFLERCFRYAKFAG